MGAQMKAVPTWPSTPVGNTIDLETVQVILDGTGKAVEEMHGRQIPTDRTPVAVTSRKLLALADQLALAEQLVRNEYWHTKGMTDVRL